jgi:NADPH:quinone reductase-like Zn-dependent oxidoreductase
MGTRDELAALLRLCQTAGVRPLIDSVLPLAEARDGFAKLASGAAFGKIVFTV